MSRKWLVTRLTSMAIISDLIRKFKTYALYWRGLFCRTCRSKCAPTTPRSTMSRSLYNSHSHIKNCQGNVLVRNHAILKIILFYHGCIARHRPIRRHSNDSCVSTGYAPLCPPEPGVYTIQERLGRGKRSSGTRRAGWVGLNPLPR